MYENTFVKLRVSQTSRNFHMLFLNYLFLFYYLFILTFYRLMFSIINVNLKNKKKIFKTFAIVIKNEDNSFKIEIIIQPYKIP